MELSPGLIRTTTGEDFCVGAGRAILIVVFCCSTLIACSDSSDSSSEAAATPPAVAGETSSNTGEIPLGTYFCNVDPPVGERNKFQVVILEGSRYEALTRKGRSLGAQTAGTYLFYPETQGMSFESGLFGQATSMYTDIGNGRASFYVVILLEDGATDARITCTGGEGAA